MRRLWWLVVLLLVGCGGRAEHLERCEEYSSYRPHQSDGSASAWTLELVEGVRSRCRWDGRAEWHNVEIVRDAGWRSLTFEPSGSIATMDVVECDRTQTEAETFCGPAGAWGDFTLWRGVP